MPNTMPGTPSPAMPKQMMMGKKILIVFIVIAALMLAALLFFKAPANAPAPQPPPPATQGNQNSLGSSSDEVSSIDQDLNATDVSNFDAGLNDMNQAIQ